MKKPSLKLSRLSALVKTRKQKKNESAKEAPKTEEEIKEKTIEQKEPQKETDQSIMETEPEKTSAEPIVEKKNEQKQPKKSKITGLKSWNKARKQRKMEKEEEQRRLEPPMLKLFTFAMTALAMSLGMSLLPFFPQPLPILLAILVAFATYRTPRLGMTAGGAIIGIGLLYHLADFYFISFLGDLIARIVFIVVWLALFIAVPLIFNRYKSALAIDFGILAAMVLFFAPSYFLAIPLILASAVFFKKYVTFTMIYYVLLTVPLQIMQYFSYTVKDIVRPDWWLEAGSSPPIFVPLTSIVTDLGGSMTHFRLYDASQVFYAISGQVTWTPDWTTRTIQDALTQYLDSVPGFIMFLVIVVGLAVSLSLFTKFLTKEGLIGRGNRLFPIFNATMAAALFFILLSALQVPLAFTADVSASTMVLGIFGTLLLTLPNLFIDLNPNKPATNRDINDKTQELLERLQLLEGQVSKVTENIPVNISSPAGKVMVIKSSIEDTLDKSSKRLYTMGELDQKFDELENLSKDIEELDAQLNTILNEYQLFSSCEFSSWIGKLKAAGLDVQTTQNLDLPRDVPVEQKVEAIKQVLEAGHSVANEVAACAQPIYNVIRLLYDPTLPSKSRSLEFAAEHLTPEEAPWAAIEALYNAINNWKRQYGAEIQMSMRHLQASLAPIAVLSYQKDLLLPALGENTPKMLEYAQKAEMMKTAARIRAEKEELDILDVVNLEQDIQSFLAITDGTLSTLKSELIVEEETIERLLPTKDYLWEKNATLRERLETATEVLADPSKYKINQIMVDMPKYLSCVDEAVQTLAFYSERREFLLNYPLAEAAIEKRLKYKKQLLPQDLPFQPKFAAEYLRLYYTQRFGEYSFDRDTLALNKRAAPES